MSLLAYFLAAAIILPVAEVQGVKDKSARTYPGRIVSVAEVVIRPQVSGEILEVGFSNGERVDKGKVLYRIDPVQYNAAVKNAEAKVVELKASLAYAEKNATRHCELVKTRAVSQDALENAMSVRDASRAALAAAEANLSAVRDDLRHCTIVAPISGRVGSTEFTEGNYVQKGEGNLVTLVQTDPIRVRFQMSNAHFAMYFGSDIGTICRDAYIGIKLVSGGVTCATGRVEYVENVADALTDTVSINALIDNPCEKFRRGQTVMVDVENRNGILCAAVPPNAVAQDIVGAYVWTVSSDNRAAKRRIVRSALQDGLLLLKSGLAIGERVVADGIHRVSEGVEIMPEVR